MNYIDALKELKKIRGKVGHLVLGEDYSIVTHKHYESCTYCDQRLPRDKDNPLPPIHLKAEKFEVRSYKTGILFKEVYP